MGGKTTATSDPRIAQLAVQTSSLGLPITRGWGRTRIKCNLIWYAGFQATPHTETTSSGGKGMGGKSTNTSFTYSASVILGLAAGPIASVPRVWRDKEVFADNQKATIWDGTYVYTPESALQLAGLSLAVGNLSQSPWAYVSSLYPSQARSYPALAYVYAQDYPLSDSASLSNHSFEVNFAVQMAGLPDADPKDIVVDFLTNSIHGVPGWTSGLLGDLTAYSNWCRANNLLLSPALEEQRAANDIVSEWMEATHCAPFWSEGVLKVGTFGDSAATGNGVTFTPDLTPAFDLTEDDLIKVDGMPVRVEIGDLSDAPNVVQVEYLDRANAYNVAIATADELALIQEFGERKRDPVTRHCICDGGIARKSAEFEKQRIINRRDTYRFRLPENFGMLDPMDYVTLTTTTDELKLAKQLVQIETIDEDSGGNLDIVAKGIDVGTGAAASYNSHSGSQAKVNTDVDPGSVAAPVLINAPSSLTGLDPELWCAVSSANPAWGGCEVWLSADNVHYQKVGVITAPARMGVSTGSLADHADPDTTNTLGVDLTASAGNLETATSANANAGATLFWLGGEIMGYQTATLTSAFHYNLTTLRRGLHGTAHGAHGSGASFVRLDDALFKLPYTDMNLGDTAYLKFPSFNVFGGSLQDLSAATAYSIGLLSDEAVDWRNQSEFAALGVNQIVNSEMAKMGPGGLWPFGFWGPWGGDSANVGSMTFNDRRVTLGDNSYAFARDQSGGTLNGSLMDLCQASDFTSIAVQRRVFFKVEPGDKLMASALVGTERLGNTWLVIGLLDETFAEVGEIAGVSVNCNIGSTAYSALGRQDLKRIEASWVVPPDGDPSLTAGAHRARWAAIWVRSALNGSANARGVVAAPFLAKVDPAQLVWPPYTPGPVDRAADVTGENTANDTANVGGVPVATLLTTINNIGSDAVLSKGEKPGALIQYNALYANWSALDAKAAALGVAGSQRTAASSAMGALATYLGGLSPSWTDNTTDTAISASAWSTGWGNAYNAVAALQAAIQGLPGVAGVDALSCSVKTISVPCTSNGTPKGSIPGFQLKVFKGTTDVTASASYTINNQTYVSGVSHSGGGLFTGPTSFPGDANNSGSVTITITSGGSQIIVEQGYSKQLEGPPYINEQIGLTLPGTTSYTVMGSFNLLCGPNGNFNGGCGAGYVSTGGVGCAVDGYIEYSLNGGSSWTTLDTFSGGTSAPGFPNGFGKTLAFSGASIGLSTKQIVMFRVVGRKSSSDGLSAVGTPTCALGWTG